MQKACQGEMHNGMSNAVLPHFPHGKKIITMANSKSTESDLGKGREGLPTGYRYIVFYV